MKIYKSIVHLIAMPLIVAAALTQASTALAHGGEDHGAAAAPLQTMQPLAPRAEAHSADIALLAVYGDGALTLYLSHADTNEPISDAQVELESGTDKALAIGAGNGAYQAPAPWLATPGKHGLVVTIEGREFADLLETTLEIKDIAPAAQAASNGKLASIGWIAALGIGALLALAAFGLFRRTKITRDQSWKR